MSESSAGAYEVHTWDDSGFGPRYVLIEASFAVPAFESPNGGSKRKTFRTKGAARYYIRKHQLGGAHIVAASSADTAK